jgi:preprotein translocase subunit SecB
MNSQSPLEMRDCVVQILDIRHNSEYDIHSEAKDCYAIKVNVDVRQKPQENDYRIRMGIVLRPEKDAVCRFQRISVELEGLFFLPLDTDENLVKQLVPLNCFAILYGIARGVVGQASGMMAGGPYMLPPYNFVELMKRKSRAAKKPAEEQASSAR